MELWYLYEPDGTFTGKIIDRHGDERIPQGLYHIACQVLVRHVDGDILLMKRAVTKKEYAGYYENTAGGSAVADETPEQCARRELKEETGLTAGNLELVDKRLNEKYKSIFYSYVTVIDCDKNSVELQPGETEGYMWMPPEDFPEFLRSGKDIDLLTERYMNYYKESGLYKDIKSSEGGN